MLQLTAEAVCEWDSCNINKKGKKEDLGTTGQSALPKSLEMKTPHSGGHVEDKKVIRNGQHGYTKIK